MIKLEKVQMFVSGDIAINLIKGFRPLFTHFEFYKIQIYLQFEFLEK